MPPAKKTLKTSAVVGEPAGRLLELSLETNLPEPYVIADGLVVQPPTKRSAKAMNEAHHAVVVYGALLGRLLSGTGDNTATTEDLAELSKHIDDAENDYNRAFFGDVHDAVMEFFSDRPQPLWAAFTADIRAHFLPSEPADDKDERIAQLTEALTAIDPENPVLTSGKEPEPST